MIASRWWVDLDDMRDYGEGDFVAIRDQDSNLVALVRPEDAKWICKLHEVAVVFNKE